jgi:Nif-specific regulatory protein
MHEGLVPTKRLSSLVLVGRLAQTEVDLEVLRREILKVVVDAMEAERATLYFLDQARQLIWSRTFTHAEVSEIRLDLGQGVAGQVAQTGEVINVPDVTKDPRFDPSTDKRTGYTTRSMLAVPMRDKDGQIMGVLQILNKKSKKAFDLTDENLLVLLAARISVIVTSSSLGRRLVPAQGIREKRFMGRDCERFNMIVGGGLAMSSVYKSIDQVARTDVTVLVNGESGTGKELVSRAIHFNSGRRSKPFVKVDCAALPEALIENELFGHERGAFTGADNRFKGKIEQAQDGTLFIDEIGELPLSVQGKLLRVLQDKEYEALGGEKTHKVRARIVAATNRDLNQMVNEGRFRRDLYFRIRVAVIELPPLRERGLEDIRELVGFFLDRMARRYNKSLRDISQDAEDLLLSYPWPGNVRELEHCVESAVVFCDGPMITRDHLALPIFSKDSSVKVTDSLPVEQYKELLHKDLTLEELEKLYIEKVFVKVEGNKSEAARRLGIGRNTLSRKLKKYRLED